MSLRELEARAARFRNDGCRAGGFPRVDLRLPAAGALAGRADATLEWQASGMAARLARVAVDALDESAPLIVRGEVRAPAVGEPPDPVQRRLGRHRVIAAPDAEPDRNRPLDRHRVQ